MSARQSTSPWTVTRSSRLCCSARQQLRPLCGQTRPGTCNGKPVKFSLSLETTVKQLRQDEQAAIQANLKQVGIDVKTIATPSGTFFGSYTEGANWMTGKFDMAIYTTGFYPDPDPGNTFLCSGVPSKPSPTGQN